MKGIACDCVGLIRGVANVMGYTISAEDWARIGSYSRLPNPDKMERAIREHLGRVPPSKARSGDVAWIAWRDGMPMHLAFLATTDAPPKHGSTEPSQRLTLIHAYEPIGKVVEHGFTNEWRERVHSWWRLRIPPKTI
jgi:hypothetical protein